MLPKQTYVPKPNFLTPVFHVCIVTLHTIYIFLCLSLLWAFSRSSLSIDRNTKDSLVKNLVVCVVSFFTPRVSRSTAFYVKFFFLGLILPYNIFFFVTFTYNCTREKSLILLFYFDRFHTHAKLRFAS